MFYRAPKSKYRISCSPPSCMMQMCDLLAIANFLVTVQVLCDIYVHHLHSEKSADIIQCVSKKPDP